MTKMVFFHNAQNIFLYQNAHFTCFFIGETHLAHMLKINKLHVYNGLFVLVAVGDTG